MIRDASHALELRTFFALCLRLEAKPMDLYAVLKAENTRLLKMLRVLEDLTQHHAAERAERVRKVAHEIRRLHAAEANNLFPFLLYTCATRQLAIEVRAEEREIERVLEELEALPGDDRRFQRRVELLHGQVRQSIARKEQELFPQAHSVIPDEEAELLAERSRNDLKMPSGARAA
jgi:hemerythrin-like domain-containing protein